MIRSFLSRRLALCSARAGNRDSTEIMKSWMHSPNTDRKPATFDSEFNIMQDALSRKLEKDVRRKKAKDSTKMNFKIPLEDQEIIRERLNFDSELLKNIVAKNKSALKTTDERLALKR